MDLQKKLHDRRLLKRANVTWLVFLDVGGFLFPDNVTEESEPNRGVLDVLVALDVLWGNHAHKFVVANTRGADSLKNDLYLLNKYGIFRSINAQNHDERLLDFEPTDLSSWFIGCPEGPHEKGPKMEEIIRQWFSGFQTNLSLAAFDNRLEVLYHMPPQTQCFAYKAKDWHVPHLARWAKANKAHVHQVESTGQLARQITRVHLRKLDEWIRAMPEGPRKERARSLFAAEALRAARIFHRWWVEEDIWQKDFKEE